MNFYDKWSWIIHDDVINIFFFRDGVLCKKVWVRQDGTVRVRVWEHDNYEMSEEPRWWMDYLYKHKHKEDRKHSMYLNHINHMAKYSKKLDEENPPCCILHDCGGYKPDPLYPTEH